MGRPDKIRRAAYQIRTDRRLLSASLVGFTRADYTPRNIFAYGISNQRFRSRVWFEINTAAGLLLPDVAAHLQLSCSQHNNLS